MTRRTVMDAQDYDKIVDKLMQFRGKIPDNTQLTNFYAIEAAKKLRYKVDELLSAIDWYAYVDASGWIK